MPRSQPHHRLPNYNRMIVLLDGAGLNQINQLSSLISGLREGILQYLFWQMAFVFFSGNHPGSPLCSHAYWGINKMQFHIKPEIQVLINTSCLSNTDQSKKMTIIQRCWWTKQLSQPETGTEQWNLFHRIFNWKKKISIPRLQPSIIDCQITYNRMIYSLEGRLFTVRRLFRKEIYRMSDCHPPISSWAPLCAPAYAQ